MKRISDKPKKILLSAHILFVVAWLGAAICTFVLSLVMGKAAYDDGMLFLQNVIKTLYHGIMIPSAIGSIMTGVLLSVFTQWGLIKYYWVIVKWVVSINMFILLTVFLGRWISVQDPSELFDSPLLLTNLGIQIGHLVFLTILSVFKPWGKVRSKVRRSQ